MAGGDLTQLAGKVAVITGASRGIGAAAAHAFAAAGASVALLARNGDTVRQLADEIGAAALPLTCDVSRYEEVAAAMDAVQARFGTIDVLVNNAGVMGPMARLEFNDPAEWGRTIDINVKGVFHGMRAVLPAMLAQGGGTVLTLSSGAAHRATDGWSSYCASKAAIAMLTRNLHLEYRDRGIRAMGLSPGTVATDMQRVIKASGVGPIAALEWSDHIPVEWPAQTLVWMCGPDADEFVGEEVSLREEAIRRRVGVI